MNITRTALGLALGVTCLAPRVAASAPSADLAPVGSTTGLVSIVVERAPGAARGAGFVAREDGLVVTARALVADAAPGAVAVELSDGRSLEATLLAADRDLALLRVEGAALDAAPIGSTCPSPGTAVRLGEVTATLGGRLAQPGGERWIAWTPSPPRFEPGAPLVTADGAVVGVALSLDELPLLGPHLAYVTAAPAERVRRLLERADRPLPALGFDLRALRPWARWALPREEADR